MNQARAVLVVLLLSVGTLLAFTAHAAVWANRTVFNTDNFVSTASRVLHDEQVQEELATHLSERLIERGHVEERLRERLSEDQQSLAPLLTVAARNLSQDLILRFLQSDAVHDGLDTVLRLVHQQVLHVIENKGTIVVLGDQVVLDMRFVLQQAAEELNLDPNIGSNLPEDSGQIVLIRNAKTAGAVQELLSLHDVIAWLVTGIAAAMFALAVLISRDHRSALRTAGILLVIVGLLAVVLLLPLRPFVAGLAGNAGAAHAAFDAFFLDYRLQSFVLMLFGLAVIVIAALLGDGDLARAARRVVRREPGAGASDFGEAVRNNATALRVSGFVGGAFVLGAWPEPSVRVYVSTFILLGLYFAALWIVVDKGELAAAIGQRISMVGRVGGSAGRNSTLAGRYGTQLRLAGIAAAFVACFAVPNFGVGAFAMIVAFTLVYLAFVDWLSTRQA